MSADPSATNELAIRYEQTAITHATQFLISPGAEEVVLDFSSGVIQDSNHEQVLPIHARLGLTWSATRRLASLLNQVVEQYGPPPTAHQANPLPGAQPSSRAQLPRMRNHHA